MADASFSPALFDFLFDLDVNNERSWFDANRDRYEREVREPMLAFIRDLEQPLHRRVSRHLVVDDRKVGGSLFRINRDTRFSNDKRPYKTNVGAQFRHEQGRDAHAPGLYFHLEPGNCFMGAGMWRPATPVLNQVRDAIVESPATWRRTRTVVEKAGWGLDGDALVRAPRGYDPDHPLIDDLRRTSVILIRTFDEDDVLAPDFRDTIVDWWAASRPLLRFMGGALGIPF